MAEQGSDTYTSTMGDVLRCKATCDLCKERNYGKPGRHGDYRAPPAS